MPGRRAVRSAQQRWSGGCGESGAGPGLLERALDGSLTGDYGLAVVRNRVDMRPCALVREAADALGVKPGTPGLPVVRTSSDAIGRVIEYDRKYWRHDAIRVHVDMSVAE